MFPQPTNPTQGNQYTLADSRYSQTGELEGADPVGYKCEIALMQTSQNFGPHVAGSGRPNPDISLISNDFVVFYADQSTLLRLSNNNFNNLLPLSNWQHKEVLLQDIPSPELDLLLQAIYTIPASSASTACGGNVAELQRFVRGVGWLPTYGIPAKSVILPCTHLFDCILSFAPLYPLEVYALAGHHDMNDLAVAASPHTLPLELWNIDEELAVRMSAKYFLHLVRLHMGRKSTLRNLLAKEPDPHSPIETCGFETQEKLRKNWYTAIALLTWDITAGMTTGRIREVIMMHTRDLTCEGCIKARDARLNAVLAEWSMSVRSI
ncbi:hypothetical protein Moror_4020 [Moniliophthora roreri MCA 2997]|uniref:BTB domain-containing protein n=1 Tax=Moniliophthora roreri (strain MCA 2997) TaxID=1381753 RepID=V2XNE3_MONRO|nr:hypothetical protein Moror_4020 [Moniliophthora roreri MCA 2997]KAI3616264.1 hypothetical protein WG66_013910 [Moniliophthora roreri]